MAKKKPAPKKTPAKKPAAKPKAAKPKAAPAPAPVTDASAELAALGFFRGAFNWEADREVPCLGERVRVLVDHTGGVVAPGQVRALELLLETDADLRPLALKAAYECMLDWVEAFRRRHPNFKGKPIAEKAFGRGCELGPVFFPSPRPSEEKPAPVMLLNVCWSEDGGNPYEVAFAWKRGAWAVTGRRRT